MAVPCRRHRRDESTSRLKKSSVKNEKLLEFFVSEKVPLICSNEQARRAGRQRDQGVLRSSETCQPQQSASQGGSSLKP